MNTPVYAYVYSHTVVIWNNCIILFESGVLFLQIPVENLDI